jgi:hypothetical protein
MRQHWKPDLQHELSWFLIAYLSMLLGVLRAVHVLQPAWDGPGSSSRSPPHRDRPTTAKQAVATAAGAIPAASLLEAGIGRRS